MRRLCYRVTTATALFLFGNLCLAQSNAEPSLHVALQPCQIFTGTLAANATAGIDVREVCNVPDEATAVELAVTVTASGAGSLKLWEYDGSLPAVPIMTYGSGTASSLAVPRLCAPVFECFQDVAARPTSAITLTLVAVGYFAPPSP